MSRFVKRVNSTRSIFQTKQALSISEFEESESVPSIDEEDSEFIRAMTPSKRRCSTLPESPYVEPGYPVAESTSTGLELRPFRRSRKRLSMLPSLDIRIQRSSRPASTRQVQPQVAAMSRRLSSSSHTSLDSDGMISCAFDSEHLIAWDDHSDDELKDILMEFDKISFKCKGKDYDEFKPINKDSLYHDLVYNYHDSQICVRKWIISYKKDELASICQILQLFVDIMGMQDINVQDVYKELEVKHLKSKVHPVVEHINGLAIKNTTQKYLFAYSAQWSKGVRNVFHAFLDTLITKCYAENILYMVTNQLNYFLMHAMASEFSAPLLHTSAFIMLIMTNTFVDLVVSTKQQYGEDYTNKTFQWTIEMITYFFDKIGSARIIVYALRDKRCNSLRIDTMQFMKYWIKTFPSHFLKEGKTYDLIKLLLVDEKDLVRLEALRCCMKIISANKQYVDFDNFKLLLFIVIQRIQDCSIQVCSTAFQCHTKAIERYPELISHDLNIPSRNASLAMLSKHFIIRKQAFLNLCVNIKLSHISPSGFLIQIANIIHALSTSERYTFMLFIVESVYQLVSELSNLELILEVIFSDLENEEHAYYLLEIFCNSAKMQYLGYLPDIGEDSREDRVVPDLQANRAIAKMILDNFARLLKRFHDYNILCLMETLNTFSVDDLETTENKEIIKQLPQLLILCFDKYVIGDVLDETTKFFAFCLTSEGFSKKYFEAKLEDLCKFVRNFPQRYVYNVNTDTIVERFTEITLKNEHCLEKLNSLLKNINFLKHSKLAWKDIYVDWNNSKEFCTIKITSLQIECCQHYLTWHFKEITSDIYDDDTIDSQIELLNINTEQYVDTLVAILSSKSAKTSVQNTAFECLSDLYLDIKHIINAVPLEQRQGFSETLSRDQFSDDVSDLLCSFVADKIDAIIKRKSLNEKDLYLDRSRRYLHFILRMIRCGIINLKHSPNILRYFNDDLSDSYGYIFTKYLDNVTKDTEDTVCNAIELIMYRTIRDIFGSTTYNATLPSIINQFNQYFRKKGTSCLELFALIIRHISVLPQAKTEMLTMIEPLLDRVTIDDLQTLKKKFDKIHFRNKDDLNVNKFRLKLNSYLPKD